jgi:pilus assembly protein CpaC
LSATLSRVARQVWVEAAPSGKFWSRAKMTAVLAGSILVGAAALPPEAEAAASNLYAEQAAIAFAPPVAPQIAFAPADAPVSVAQPMPEPAPQPEVVHAPTTPGDDRPRRDEGHIAFTRHVTLTVNKSKNMRLDIPYADAAVAQPAIADVVPISDRQLYILGKKIGSTNVLLYDQSKRLIGVVDVDVHLDTAAMSAELRAAVGAHGVRISEVNGSIVLSGDAGDAQTADRVMAIASSLAPEGRVVNAMNISSPQQVELQVRFVEASRSAVRNLGVRWAAFWHNGRSAAVIGRAAGTGVLGVPDTVNSAAGVSPFATILTQIINSRSGSLDLVLNALEEQAVVRRLAEPNLVALSGQSADFLAGGKFPVPVSQANSASTSLTGTVSVPTISIQWQEFGVRLKFTPTVMANGVISLRLQPEVSDLDPALSVSSGGVSVPGLIQRRADTTVELRDGQSFAIAGMMSAKSQHTLDAFPWLGTVPVLGALFSSKEFEQNETELVVIVSPHLVKPVPPGRRLNTPLDNSLAANDLDLFLNQKLEIPKSPPTYVQANGVDQSLVGGMAPGAPGVKGDPNSWSWPWEKP